MALINGQLLLVESSKKRLDEVVEDLQQEIVHLRKELEEAEKQYVMRGFHSYLNNKCFIYIIFFYIMMAIYCAILNYPLKKSFNSLNTLLVPYVNQ